MEVRELGRDEAALWRELKLAALRESPDAFRRTYEDESRLPMDAWERAVRPTAANRSDLKLVAEVEGRPVGVARGRLDGDRPHRADIVLLWIRPEARGQGAAGLLMERVLDWAQGQGATLAELFVTEGNEAAADFYASLGFHATDIREPLREGSDRQSILMRRVLDPGFSDGRITLRPWSLDDVPEITSAIQDPAIERFRPEIPFPYREEHAREYIESTRREWEEGSRFDFAVTDADSGELLGSVRVVRRSAGVWEVGYWVKRDARGRGVATRAVRLVADWAFERLDVVRLQLRTDVDNPASQKVAERCGFMREGVLRAAGRLRTGELGDVVMYSRLRAEAVEGGETRPGWFEEPGMRRDENPVAIVRRASTEDAQGLARMRWDFSPEEQGTQSWDEFEKDFRTWLEEALQELRWTVWVAEAEDELLGTVWLQDVEKVPRPGRFDARFGYVTNTYVVPEARSRGIGGQLLDALIAHAREVGLEFLVVWPSPESVDFYARAGFVTSGTAHAGVDDYEVLELPL